MAPRKTPIIVGVGDIKNRSIAIEDAVEPANLMLRAIQNAFKDTRLPCENGLELWRSIDSVDVVATWTWEYEDLPSLLSQKLGINPAHSHYSPHGGNQPVKLLDEAARRISLGESKVAIVTGGEALASLTACAAANKMPPPGWTKPKNDVESVFSPTNRELGSSMIGGIPWDGSRLTKSLGNVDLGAVHSIGAPIHVYPLYENAFRAHRGQSIQQNNAESAKLYGDFAKVAETNPVAWNYGKPSETEASIGTVAKKNRMICFPYPLLMNAFNTVNLAGACILTSTDYAKELGIPESRWIYPLAGAGTQDASNFWERPNFYTSPSISHSIDATLKGANLNKAQIDMYDFYSCFPIVPKIACNHLGLSMINPQKPITLLGGLTSFGGAGNNYSMHTYTVDFNRDNTPRLGHIVGRLKSTGARFLANHGDEETLRQLASSTKEPIGRSGWVRIDKEGPDGHNFFSFEKTVKL
ncbi:acetyl-CoA acetyltransferas-like protein [Venturia nashicola]|uniref:Acetyl-CoA acetyltransferas-like protein n=1 Tax=Venturia nashicola TaxID=86259 RepID=A0A4Z1P318_9PEZI|nr:acetyl-CoA acetyltransferas-like protein [Venturia nashicola]TLD35907.1 acetyl-CoA acetyltransferas-like protein [Venturia nashicola]